MPGRSCKIDGVLDFISEPWTLAVIHQLTVGPRRTLELFSSFAGLSTKTLGARLKKLERGGIVARKSFSETPPRVEYSLTEKAGRFCECLTRSHRSLRSGIPTARVKQSRLLAGPATWQKKKRA